MKGLSPPFFTLFEPLGDLRALSRSCPGFFFSNLTSGCTWRKPVHQCCSKAPKDFFITAVWGILIGNLLCDSCSAVGKSPLCGNPRQSSLPRGLLSVRSPSRPSERSSPFLWLFLFLLGMWAPLMSSGSPFLMGAATIAIRGYVVQVGFPSFKRQRSSDGFEDRYSIGSPAFATSSWFPFVVEILRNVTEIAVLLKLCGSSLFC